MLVIGGFDPSGAGLQADIETCAALGTHALPIATAITIQNTARVARIVPLAAEDVFDQITHLIADTATPAVCKIGMLPNHTVLNAIIGALTQLPRTMPILLDPVLNASSGARFSDPQTLNALQQWLPRVTLFKPNLAEARQIIPPNTELSDIGRALHVAGCRYTLLSGGDEAIDDQVRHVLYRDGTEFASYTWPYQAGRFHGSGCTLTTAIASFVALGHTIEASVAAAQAYTWHTIANAYSIGARQAIPARNTAATRVYDSR